MKRYELSARAEEDLDGIWWYTDRTWGERQASKYLRQLKSRIEDLSVFPERGQRRDDISPGLWCSYVGRHLIIYRHTEPGIRVIRVLHDQMDVPQRMAESSEE
jgi:toxin ParE1/3/4